MTYRTGNHWGVTVVDEQPDSAQLVAVVVNGDQALAERICALLNSEKRQLDRLEAELESRERLEDRDWRMRNPQAADSCTCEYRPNGGRDPACPVHADAPSARVGSTETAQNASEAAECAPDGPEPSQALPRGAPRDGWGFNRLHLHPTCADVSAIDEPPGTEWICTSACRQPADSLARRCICNDPPPTVIGRDGKKNGTAVRPDGWACPRHGQVI
jgi:hypothetical protein